MACLYRLTFPSGKSYVGITNGCARRRFYRHAYTARQGSQTAVHRAIRKYGTAATKVETLVVADWSYLVELEQSAIAALGARAPDGYNLTNGGEGTVGMRHSEAARAKMSAREYGPDVRARMSAGATGKQMSHNTSGVTGVFWDRSISKWRPRITQQGRVSYLGVFEDWFDAVAARKSAEAGLGLKEKHHRR